MTTVFVIVRSCIRIVRTDEGVYLLRWYAEFESGDRTIIQSKITYDDLAQAAQDGWEWATRVDTAVYYDFDGEMGNGERCSRRPKSEWLTIAANRRRHNGIVTQGYFLRCFDCQAAQSEALAASEIG